ncbi:uncharacterized protein [Choristoneura fumiferana]|uniref:uncharacterized protein n=1 Tax=Choristoneura fumiferana TaxID=7141 RepID=UPI003D15A964
MMKFGLPSKVFGSGVYELVTSDQVEVNCTGYDGTTPSHWFGYKVGFRSIPKPTRTLVTPKPRPQSDPINVLIIAIDSASHNGFIRRMPKSHEVITKELKAVVLNKYNVVGDGTAAALFPLLSGKTSFEHEDYRKALSTTRLDEKLLVFHVASTLGYRTLYFESMPWIGTFQNRHNGFSHQPTDHYLLPLLMLQSDAGRKWWNGDKGRYCIGDTAQYALMFNLTRQFYNIKGKRFSFTFIADISHDDFNVVTTADEELVGLLRSLKVGGKLEDTVLIVMGDHGTRYKSTRDTYQGKLEEQLPFMAIRLPLKLVNSRPDALKALEDNANVLTTPFDIHTTLLDVLGADESRNRFTVKGSDLPRGMSLLKPIPPQRSCGEAGVVPYWCACASWRVVPAHAPQYTRAAHALLQYINNVTSTKRSLCRVRKLTYIEWVMQKISSSERQSSDYYQAKIVTSPGYAVYEGAMRYLKEEDRYLISVNDISRITEYGHEPDCVWVVAPHLGNFCYCK